MFNSTSLVTAAQVKAVDGDIGPVEDALFDDRHGVIRYLVVDAGTWLAERDVLISPYSIKQPLGRDGVIHVALTRRLVRTSPALDIDRPVSREQEQEFLRHYHYPAYWDGGGLWALGGTPYPSVARVSTVDRGSASDYPADMQLHSVEQLLGYEVQATGQGIGQVQDLVFDEDSWQIRYLVVDTHGGGTGGHTVLISRLWVERIDWARQLIHTTLTREQVRGSPVYEDIASIHRDYEIRLHANYHRPGYWP